MSSQLTQLKQGTDLHTSTFTQFVAYEVARDGFLDKHVKLIRQIYRERRDVMLQSLEEFFPAEVTWTRPKGGLFLWVTLPQGLDMKAIFNSAIEQNVAFVLAIPSTPMMLTAMKAAKAPAICA